MTLDSTTILAWVINAFISFFFGVLGGVVSHILIREYDHRANEIERRERMRRRIFLPNKENWAWLRKLLAPAAAFTAVMAIGILTGSLWVMLGVAVVMGFVVGRIGI